MAEENAGLQGQAGGGTSTAAPEVPGGGVSAGSGGGQAPATGDAGGVVSGGAAAAAPAPGGTNDYLSVRDALANYGLDLRDRFGDDHAALQHLIGQIRAAEQSQELAQWGQQYVRHAPQFEAFLREQREAEQRQQQAQQGWWKAPEYDPSWLGKLRRDEQGNLQVVPGNDPSIAQKYLAWAEHQRGFIDRFSADPIGAIKPGIEQVVREVAQQLMGQQLGQYTAQSQAKQLIDGHSAWLHERDQAGKVVYERGPTGQPAPRLSEAGRRYAGYVQEAEQSGMTSVEAQDRYALGMVQRDLLLARHREGQGGQQAGEAAKARFIQQAAGGSATGQAQQPAAPAQGTNGSRPVRADARGLQELMMQQMQANGIRPGDVLTRQ